MDCGAWRKEVRALLAVVLAAGDGTRMAPLAHRIPKPLMLISGRPLITYTLSALAKAGVHEVILVDGYLGDRIRHALKDGSAYGVRLTYVRSDHVGRGNALSLYAAREATGGRPFLLAMGDHLISSTMVQRLLHPLPYRNTMCVDRDARWIRLEEATLVWVEPDGRITQIGKGLARYNGVDTGLFWFIPLVFRAIEAVRDATGVPPTLTETICWLIERGPGVWAREVWGAAWMDVDTPADLRRARRWMSHHPGPTDHAWRV